MNRFFYILIGLFFALSPVYSNTYLEKIEVAIEFYENGDYELSLMELMQVKVNDAVEKDLLNLWLSKNLYQLKNYQLALNSLQEVQSIDTRKLQALNYFEMDSFERVVSILNSTDLLNEYNDTVYYLIAESQFELEDYDRAIISYRILKQVNPQRANIYKRLGICAYYQQDYLDALTSLQFASNYSKNDFETYNYLGMTYFNLHNIGKAIETLKLGIDRMDYRSAESAVNLSIVYDEIFEEDSALWALNLALEIDSNKIDAYYFLGNRYYSKKRYELSNFYYQKLLQINPRYEYAYEQLANSYYNSGLYDEAIEKYRQSTFFENQNANSYNLIGLSYLRGGDYTQAKSYFKQALEVDPSFGIAYYNLAGLAFNQKRYDEAIGYCSYAFSYLIDDPQVYFLLGKIYVQLGQLDLAQNNFESTIRFNSLNSNAYLYLGDIALMSNQKRKAEFYFKMHTSLSPESFDGQYYLGVTQFNLKEFDAARISLENALRLDQETEKVMFALSKTYLKVGESGTAIMLLNELLPTGYQKSKVYLLLSLAHSNLKQNKKAKYYENLAYTLEPKLKKYIF